MLDSLILTIKFNSSALTGFLYNFFSLKIEWTDRKYLELKVLKMPLKRYLGEIWTSWHSLWVLISLFTFNKNTQALLIMEFLGYLIMKNASHNFFFIVYSLKSVKKVLKFFMIYSLKSVKKVLNLWQLRGISRHTPWSNLVKLAWYNSVLGSAN